MIPPSIKSRPTYGVLRPQPGRSHVLVADAEGAAAILDLATIAPADFFARARVIYTPTAASARPYVAQLRALRPHAFHEGASLAAALPSLVQTLAEARMGTRLYLAGTEGLIGQAMRIALDAGMDHASIMTEHRGSLNRRVQCVHCKGVTENVATQPVVCAHCGLHLFVRDHYSRRLAAFQGVCVDAEEPGAIPATEVVFP